MEDINYTIISTDETNYAFVLTNLPTPDAPMTTITITSLTANCTIVVLDIDDYIIVNSLNLWYDPDKPL